MVHIVEIPLPPPPPPSPRPAARHRPRSASCRLRCPESTARRAFQAPYSASTVRVVIHNGTAASGCADARCRCHAMMEIIQNEHVCWLVSRIELEHCHQLASLSDLAAGRLLLTVGMLFDSVSIAKAFYYTYNEKMRFKARTGSGRRSRDNQMLIIQRFLCCRGNPQPVKSKRGPSRLPLAAVGAVEKDRDSVEAMQLECREHEREVENGLPEISAKI